MIGSFWNLCRACPSMPVDKLHSEYRSTYRWHEYTGGSRPEVIRRPPVANQFGSNTCNEPPLPRRKKCPELAYKTHEFINCDPLPATAFKNDINAANRARSEARGTKPTTSRRSKSEGPHRMTNGDVRHAAQDRIDAAVERGFPGQSTAGESSGLFKKTITKLSTEYRLQFIWPNTRKSIKSSEDAVDLPRKSRSMGALRSARSNAMPTVHKKRTIHENEATVQELEPLVNDVEKPEKITTQRRHVRPFSQYGNKAGHTEKENFGFAADVVNNKTDNKATTALVNGIGHKNEQISWYKDVIELRKKAGEYKHRGWGIEIQPDVFNKQKEIWDQVSRRSSLSALSLASSIHSRPITKEEKEKENNKKSSPTKASQVHFVDNKFYDGATNRLHGVRHHLERTTGPDMEDGALLPSPTREKLMPTIPKNDESYNSQRGSPKKSATSRHGSPQKGSPQKSPKKAPVKSVNKGRSQSVGPAAVTAATAANVESSPKRQIRSGSTVPSSVAVSKSNQQQKKTPVSTPTIVERRPRPTTLSTSNNNPPRSKSSSLPPNGRSHSSSIVHQLNNTNNLNTNQNDTNSNVIVKLSPSSLTIPNLKKSYTKSNTTTKAHAQRPKSQIINGHHKDPMTDSTIICGDNKPSAVIKSVTKGQDKKTAAENDDDTEKDGGNSISSVSPLPVHEIIEHIVKSPPEPTRVKSPEQIIMRSPDPVNWTVPLDTGKTFTVTQNVRDGEPIIRPQSELKASTPIEKPPPAPMSAPPELAEPAKNEAWNNDKAQDNTDSDSIVQSIATVIPAQMDNLISTNSEEMSSLEPTSTPSPQPLLLVADTGVPTTAAATALPAVAAPAVAPPVVAAPPPAVAPPAAVAVAPPTIETRYDKPIPGSTLRCLDDPTFDPEINSPIGSGSGGNGGGGGGSSGSGNSGTNRTMASDVLEKARDRFDRFWGGNKEENV